MTAWAAVVGALVPVLFLLAGAEAGLRWLHAVGTDRIGDL